MSERFVIRPESSEDNPAISRLVTDAFAGAPHAGGNEAAIVDGLRSAGALSLGLVFVRRQKILGFVAFSPVLINGMACGWYGLGPVAVAPEHQGQGIGHDLIQTGLSRLRAHGAAGCVVLGDPEYYGRFGFCADAALTLADVPPAYFQAVRFGASPATGDVTYHPAFYAG